MTGELNIDGNDLIYSSHCLASAKNQGLFSINLTSPNVLDMCGYSSHIGGENLWKKGKQGSSRLHLYL